jgi:hypothetical protein
MTRNISGVAFFGDCAIGRLSHTDSNGIGHKSVWYPEAGQTHTE